ncbi:uncharacterized protein LOC116349537 [Contarinia nasturtii]|uniref:uncharacterized protein LOC116349537 n=1 Tax=Contarinia nasturtii TaxID=265458 RepID=UPI0012D3AE63|nr:uncharacterized protein LOC116349537 [Contarinia nasturtii]
MSPILSPQIKSPQEIINGNFDLVGDQFTFEKLSQWNELLKGLDIDMIEHFAKKFHRNIEYIVKNDTLNTAEDGKRSANNPKIDIFIGPMEEKLINCSRLTASRQYYHESLTWCVRKSQLIPVWTTIFYICRDIRVYAIAGITIPTLLCVLYYFQKLERYSKWDWYRLVFDGLYGALGFPYTFTSESLTVRVIIVLLSFAALVFSTVTSTAILLLIMIPTLNPQIKTVQEIINGHFELVGDRFAFEKLLEWNETYPSNLLTLFKVVNRPDEYLHQLKWNDKLAVAVPYELSRSRTQMGNDQFNARKDVYCFDRRNNIYEYPLTMLVRRDFTLINEFDRFIKHASECGLIEKWLNQYRSHVKEKFRISYNSVQTNYFPIMYSFYGLMLLAAFLTFIFERIVYEKVHAPNAPPYWRFIEMSIDPYRYFFLDTFGWISDN